MLSAQLPDNGWPTGTLVDLLVQQPGIGEVRLLAPALRKVAHKRVVFLQPPHAPQTIALAGLGLAPSQLIWVKSATSSDALWAAEQVLRSGSCGALMFWCTHVRPESLRRLHLAAQAGETLFYAMRPMAAVQDASPAPLRMSLRPAPGGIEIVLLKCRGPQRDAPLFHPLAVNGKVLSDHHVSRPVPVPARHVEPQRALDAAVVDN